MAFLQKPASNRVPTIGIFAPCDPRRDHASRERALNICAMTAKVLGAITLPGLFGAKAEKPGIYLASQTVENEADADAVAYEFKQNGVDVIVLVPDTLFAPAKTAIALTAHFPTAPLCCIAGNHARQRVLVSVDALIAAYSQTGRLCHALIGNLPENGQNPDFDATSKAEITDLVWAMTAAQWLKGKRFLAASSDAQSLTTSSGSLLAMRRLFGIERVSEAQSRFTDLIRTNGGYDPKELKDLAQWAVDGPWKNRIHPDGDAIRAARSLIYTNPAKTKPKPLTAAHKAKVNDGLKLYLVVRNYLRDLNCIAGGWTSQASWGADEQGIPLVGSHIADALFNSTFDHRGKKCALPFATGDAGEGLLTMIAFSALTGGEPIRAAAGHRTYEPWEIQKKADELGIKLDPQSAYLQRGAVHLAGAGSGSLDWGKDSLLFEAAKQDLAGGEFSPGYLSPAGIACQVGRLVYSDLNGTFTMIRGEAESIALPQPLAEAFCHASAYSGPHTWITFKGITAAVAKYGCPASHLSLVRNLPTRRWQYFSDYTNVQNFRWEGTPEFTEGQDRIAPMLYRISGGETYAKMKISDHR